MCMNAAASTLVLCVLIFNLRNSGLEATWAHRGGMTCSLWMNISETGIVYSASSQRVTRQGCTNRSHPAPGTSI